MEFNEDIKYSRAVWLEGTTVFSETIPTKWINYEKKIVYWPKGNYKKPMSQMADVHPKLFDAFELVKVKVQSGKFMLFSLTLIFTLRLTLQRSFVVSILCVH